MVSEVSEGVRVSVLAEYQPAYPNLHQNYYLFTYRIVIENCSSNTIKLLRRYWRIYDANGEVRHVEGEGVVGQQPVLEPGEKHEYTSGCNLKTAVGKMAGIYLMEKIVDGRKFEVTIPEFTLVAPFVLN